jgi:hypothetical protein
VPIFIPAGPVDAIIVDNDGDDVAVRDGYSIYSGFPIAARNNSGESIIVKADDDGYLRSISQLADVYDNKVGVVFDSGNAGSTPDAYRLQVEADIKRGASVNLGSYIPSNPGLLFLSFLMDSYGSENMLIDGSTTPVEFKITADPSRDIILSELRIVYTNDDMVFDGDHFGPKPALTNGVLIDIQVNDGETADLINIKINEDFLRFITSAGINILLNNTGPKDVLIASFNLGGDMRLVANSSDFVRATVRDNVTDVKQKYLTSTIYGVKE